ncbi:MAG: hypothetical protein WAO91_01115 [Candidatus Nitrosotenuis sp.]
MAKTGIGLLAVVVLGFGIASAPLSEAMQHNQVAATDKGTLKVSVSTDPQTPKTSGQTKLKIDFVNPKTGAIQQHIDYSVSITKDGKSVFGPIPLAHTSLGTVTIPVQFSENGEHQVTIDVQGILFAPIPSEKATLTLKVGDVSDKKTDDKAKKVDEKKKDKSKKKIKSDKKKVTKAKKPKTA